MLITETPYRGYGVRLEYRTDNPSPWRVTIRRLGHAEYERDEIQAVTDAEALSLAEARIGRALASVR